MALKQAEKVALGASKYIKPIPRPFTRNIEEQMNEYYGLGNYHCKSHQELIEAQLVLSSAFKTSDFRTKTEIAGQELQIWKKYIESRLSELPPEYRITSTTQSHLHKIWAEHLHRNTDSIEASRMLEFHYQFTERYPFDVPVDKRSLFEMVHPHAGYMVLLPYRFTFNKLIEFYNVQLVASYERSLGEELLSRQISCFNYFSCISEESGPLLDKAKVNELMKTFKFPQFEKLDEFLKYFSWTLQEFEGEYKGTKNEEIFMRLSLARRIFLDFNL